MLSRFVAGSLDIDQLFHKTGKNSGACRAMADRWIADSQDRVFRAWKAFDVNRSLVPRRCATHASAC